MEKNSKKELLPKSWNSKEMESKWYAFWESNGYFTPDLHSSKPPFCIVIPPPNVTGSLHIGHALNNTLQDILSRYKRMAGFNVLWLPGTDHAGIATQNVVERILTEEGLDRLKIGRDRFIERVWKWKEESGGNIIYQLRRLGASCDWTRERFTLDEGLSKAVRVAFVTLYNKGLIYRGNYIINWCPRCGTALSDLEVEQEEITGKLYYILYPLKEPKSDIKYIIVATTRPETMFGDTAVAVHPEDDKYADAIGASLLLPLTDREIPVIGDDRVEREFGTGAVKITPGHDFADFETANRHNLPFVKAIDEHGRMTEHAYIYKGLDRFEARTKVAKDLENASLLQKIEDYKMVLGHCYRCKTVVEPMLSVQWFVRAEPLSQEAIRAVESGRIKLIPEMWNTSYFSWMRNIRDWCISRQIWWGHRIPAWYCGDCGEIAVSIEDQNVCVKCGSKNIEQDKDVLDTWFSSALWPFSTLGWPDRTRDLSIFYPTSVLVTSFDILFFWVARMIMMGLFLMKDVPFMEVYLHALVRDSKGQKMSKSKGNVIDPLVMMDKYGVDAFRFALAALTAQGREIKLSEDRIEGYRHFTNKLWNASKFILMNTGDIQNNQYLGIIPESILGRWIYTLYQDTIKSVRDAIDVYNFDSAARILYNFIWHELCDWYLEAVKSRLSATGEPEHKKLLLYILDGILKMLHPFMPMITEEIWQRLPGSSGSIMISKFPEVSSGKYPDERNKFKYEIGRAHV